MLLIEQYRGSATAICIRHPQQRTSQSLQVIMFKYSLDRKYKMSIYSIYYRNKEHYYYPQGTVLKVEWYSQLLVTLDICAQHHIQSFLQLRGVFC